MSDAVSQFPPIFSICILIPGKKCCCCFFEHFSFLLKKPLRAKVAKIGTLIPPLARQNQIMISIDDGVQLPYFVHHINQRRVSKFLTIRWKTVFHIIYFFVQSKNPLQVNVCAPISFRCSIFQYHRDVVFIINNEYFGTRIVFD